MLIGVELIQELVETVILTGRIKNESPVSLLLIAKPECGKTSVVLERPCKSVFALTDVSGRGLQTMCQNNPDISHFILNDMTAPMSHKQNVSALTISMIMAMTEEGIQAVAMGGGQVETFKNGKRAIIGCVTPAMANDKRQWWVKHGLSSRLLPFFYSHSAELKVLIKDAITKDADTVKSKDKKEFKVPDFSIQVEIPEIYKDDYSKMADTKSADFNEEGYRRLKQYRCLLRAHAVRRTGKWKNVCVEPADIYFLQKITPYVTYDEPYPL